MQVKELKSVLYSLRGCVQFAIVYDYTQNADLVSGCSVEYAIKEYGERELHRISASDNLIIISVI